MDTYHIHITGLVQGVGFRPMIFRVAAGMGLHGCVSNEKDGVHVTFNATDVLARSFYQALIDNRPSNAIVVTQKMQKVASVNFDMFAIVTGSSNARPWQLLAPDYNLCPDCREEILNNKNRRSRYPFTTCLNCGPRYSIIEAIPYEREFTTMKEFIMCPDCRKEYYDVNDRRHFSQTNSCPDCTIPMHLYNSSKQLLCNDVKGILQVVNKLLEEGAIISMKGIGGYLLLCDATNEKSIVKLRQRKHRPEKPFALMYRDIDQASKDLVISDKERQLVNSKAGPILLCDYKERTSNHLCRELIAPGLRKIGWMLPCSPLLQLMATDFKRPLVATSGNISGSPIIFEDDKALEILSAIADYIVTYDRNIVVPQDDSVMQVTRNERKIILRRSRGMAPNYFPHPFPKINYTVLATGAELKNAFAIHDHDRLYVSQFLGNQENLLSQQALECTVDHMLGLLQAKPTYVMADKHPGYFVSAYAENVAARTHSSLISVQHHHAHFAAVLAENNLLRKQTPVLGVIWDGAGFGNDGQIWGGEFFIYQQSHFERAAHLDYFPQLLGDKMNREPRLSALSLLSLTQAEIDCIRPKFSDQEWRMYSQLVKQPAQVLTSSMGRLLDGLASLLDICHFNSYEGEAAMKLEAAASQCKEKLQSTYSLPLHDDRIDFRPMVCGVLVDLHQGFSKESVAKKIFLSLASMIFGIAEFFDMDHLAFSGGVFQNALLVDLIEEKQSERNKLYWHQELSPNDECIGFGQLACFHHVKDACVTSNFITSAEVAETA